MGRGSGRGAQNLETFYNRAVRRTEGGAVAGKAARLERSGHKAANGWWLAMRQGWRCGKAGDLWQGWRCGKAVAGTARQAQRDGTARWHGADGWHGDARRENDTARMRRGYGEDAARMARRRGTAKQAREAGRRGAASKKVIRQSAERGLMKLRNVQRSGAPALPRSSAGARAHL